MTDTTTAPTYTLRGLQLIGWRNMAHALDFLYAGGELKQAGDTPSADQPPPDQPPPADQAPDAQPQE